MIFCIGGGASYVGSFLLYLRMALILTDFPTPMCTAEMFPQYVSETEINKAQKSIFRCTKESLECLTYQNRLHRPNSNLVLHYNQPPS